MESKGTHDSTGARPILIRSAVRLPWASLRHVDGHSVEITKRQAVLRRQVVPCVDGQSRVNTQKGRQGRTSEYCRIERRNIRHVYTPEETREWRAANLDHHLRDIAVLADEAVDVEHICSVLTRLNDNVLSGEALKPEGAQWLTSYGMNNMLLRFTIFGDRDPQACVRELMESLRLFGIRTRQ